MNIILFGDDHWYNLFPLTLTRPIADLRIGLLTIKEKWELMLHAHGSYITQEYLSEKYSIEIAEENILINATYLPTIELVKDIKKLALNQAILINDDMIAARVSKAQLHRLNENPETFSSLVSQDYPADKLKNLRRITSLADIIRSNSQEIESDIKLKIANRATQPISNTNVIIGNHPVFFEEGVVAECCIFNTTQGAIYIGRHTEIMEGSILRGPIGIGDHNIVKIGSKIYHGTSSGPGCRLGGEIKNTVFQANSNKGHDGFVGDSIIGEWCNLGAGTNTSNMKNNYQTVKLWSSPNQKFENTGLQFCGLVLADHCKCGINTMFNTGTVVGVACNIFGDGYPRNFIPSFSWGGASGFIEHKLNKVIETAEIVMARRDKVLTEAEKKILQHIYDTTISPSIVP